MMATPVFPYRLRGCLWMAVGLGIMSCSEVGRNLDTASLLRDSTLSRMQAVYPVKAVLRMQVSMADAMAELRHSDSTSAGQVDTAAREVTEKQRELLHAMQLQEDALRTWIGEQARNNRPSALWPSRAAVLQSRNQLVQMQEISHRIDSLLSEMTKYTQSYDAKATTRP